MMVAFFVNAKGEKEEPIYFIWKSQNPRGFKNLRDKQMLANVNPSSLKGWGGGGGGGIGGKPKVLILGCTETMGIWKYF